MKKDVKEAEIWLENVDISGPGVSEEQAAL